MDCALIQVRRGDLEEATRPVVGIFWMVAVNRAVRVMAKAVGFENDANDQSGADCDANCDGDAGHPIPHQSRSGGPAGQGHGEVPCLPVVGFEPSATRRHVEVVAAPGCSGIARIKIAPMYFPP